jgi:hypothetical protein
MGDGLSKAAEEGADAEALGDMFKNEEIYDTLKSELDGIGLDGDKLNLDPETGKMYYDGKEVDFAKMKDAIFDGDLLGALEDGGVNPDEFTAKTRDEAAKFKTATEGSGRYIDNANLEQDFSYGRQMGGELGETYKDEADWKEKTGKNKDFDDAVEKEKEKAKEDPEKKYCSKWTKVCYTAAALFAGGLLFGIVEAHACKMSGCWLVENTSGAKCKVSALSCNKDNDDSDCPSGGVSVTLPATSCVKFIPKCNKKPPACCAPGGTLGQQKTCDGSGGSCNIITGTGGSCDPLCDCSKVTCPTGYHLHCVNASFWDAWNDMGLPNPFKGLSGLLGKIIKYVVLIIAIIIVVVIVGKLLGMAFGGGKKK